jgi:hypothetical protein
VILFNFNFNFNFDSVMYSPHLPNIQSFQASS